VRTPSIEYQQQQQQRLEQEAHVYISVNNNVKDGESKNTFITPHVYVPELEETFFEYQKPLQATAPATPSYKRKRGDTQSRSLPDIRFPDYGQHQTISHPHDENDNTPISISIPKRSISCSPSKYLLLSTDSLTTSSTSSSTSVAVFTTEQTTITIRRGQQQYYNNLRRSTTHHRSQSHSTHLTGLIENVNEIDGMVSPLNIPTGNSSTKPEVISPTRYRHTFS